MWTPKDWDKQWQWLRQTTCNFKPPSGRQKKRVKKLQFNIKSSFPLFYAQFMQ